MEGLLVIKLQDKLSSVSYTIVGVYLPPENSVHCTNPDAFFQHVVSFCYEHVEDDILVFCGDFNARTGKKLDFIEDVDDIPSRVIIDEVPNDHGVSLINFCLQTNCCVINGRITPLNDGYTSVSHRGKAIVDYFITRHTDLECINSFKVVNITDFIAENGLMHLAENKVSDHGILVCEVDARANDMSTKQLSENAIGRDESVSDMRQSPTLL